MAAATKKATKKATSKTTKAAAKATDATENGAAPKVDKRKDASLRLGRGELEKRVLEVVNDIEAGKVKVDGPATPHRVAGIIGESGDKPSAGAVAAIFGRWDNIGFALFTEKPLAFKRVSAAGKKQGLDTLKEKAREKAKAERAAERAAAKEASEKPADNKADADA
jgi:hypothetical protein